MSRFINNSIIFIFINFIFGCFPSELFFSKKTNKPFYETPPITQFGPRGVVEKSLKLKFKFNKDKISTLQAIVTSSIDYNFPVTINWKLGPNIELVSGQLNLEISKMNKDELYIFELKLKNLNSDDSKFIRFEAIGSNLSRRIYTSGIFNTTVDSSFEKIVQEIEEYKKENE